MAVRVNLLIRARRHRALESAAVLNSGFEADEPHLVLPHAAVESLYGRIPSGTVAYEAFGVFGAGTVLITPDPVSVQVRCADHDSAVVFCRIMISQGETEILVSDAAIEGLRVEIVRPKQGLWKFSGERRSRASVPPRLW